MNNNIPIAIDRLRGLIEGFAGKRVLVIGDMAADEYLVGRPTRIARDAPVLILEMYEERTMPGEAGNVAVNMRSLGAEVFLVGIVGEDVPGQRLRRAIGELGIHQDGLVSDTGRPTTTKTRIVAGSLQMVQRQIVRIDRVDRTDLVDGSRGRIIEYIQRVLPSMDAVMLSDYETSVISPQILEVCLPLARGLGKITVADAHGSLFRFQGVTAITPNQPEAELTLGMGIQTQAELNEAGQRLLDGSQAKSILITRGAEGMSLFERDKAPVHLPVHRLDHGSEIVDTNGAGDTVAATFTLALTAGADFVEAARIANAAAALVVRRPGSASNTPEELMRAFHA